MLVGPALCASSLNTSDSWGGGTRGGSRKLPLLAYPINCRQAAQTEWHHSPLRACGVGKRERSCSHLRPVSCECGVVLHRGCGGRPVCVLLVHPPPRLTVLLKRVPTDTTRVHGQPHQVRWIHLPCCAHIVRLGLEIYVTYKLG